MMQLIKLIAERAITHRNRSCESKENRLRAIIRIRRILVIISSHIRLPNQSRDDIGGGGATYYKE
jgi:hypothetical protein